MKIKNLTEQHKVLLIIAFGLLASLFTYELKAQDVSFGPKLGFTQTTATGDDAPDEVESVSGLVGGLFIKYQASSILAIQPEILYHQKGAFWNPDDNFNFDYRINYLEVPLLLKLQIPLANTVFPYVYAGPYGAFVLDNEVTGEVGPFNTVGSEDINDFDAGAVLGGGVDFQVNALYLGLDLRYGIGMRNVLDADDNDDEADIKNRSFSAMVSLGINL